MEMSWVCARCDVGVDVAGNPLDATAIPTLCYNCAEDALREREDQSQQMADMLEIVRSVAHEMASIHIDDSLDAYCGFCGANENEDHEPSCQVLAARRILARLAHGINGGPLIMPTAHAGE